MRCHLSFFFELSAARSFLCPLSMKYTLASGKQALSSISALEIKRRISFFRSASDLSAFPSFIFPCLRESGTIVLSGMTAPDGGGTRERAGENCRRAGERLSCSAAFGRGGDVPLCRRRAGEGLFHSAAVRRGTGRPLRRRLETSARQSVFWGGRSRPASPPRRGVGAYRSLRFCRSVSQAAFLLPDCRRRGNDSFSKLS